MTVAYLFFSIIPGPPLHRSSPGSRRDKVRGSHADLHDWYVEQANCSEWTPEGLKPGVLDRYHPTPPVYGKKGPKGPQGAKGKQPSADEDIRAFIEGKFMPARPAILLADPGTRIFKSNKLSDLKPMNMKQLLDN